MRAGVFRFDRARRTLARQFLQVRAIRGYGRDMSHGDSFDTFAGTAVTYGDGSRRYRARRIDRNALATTQPGATAIPTGNGHGVPLQFDGSQEVKIAEVLSRPEAVELQVFVVEVEDEAEFVAFADRAKEVVYPLEHAVLEVTDWGEARGPDVQSLLDEVPFEDGDLHGDHDDDAVRRTAADRDQSGKRAHQPARRQRAGGRWVG